MVARVGNIVGETPANNPETLKTKPVLAPAAAGVSLHDVVCPHCGKRYGEPVHAGPSITEFTSKLSDAQKKVFGYLLEGLTEPQIAVKVHRSKHTVHDHTKAIYAAAGVKKRVQLVRMFASSAAPEAETPVE